MQIQTILLSILAAATVVKAAVNEPCYGDGGIAGVCISASSCSAAGGKSINGACPADPENIKCCTKPKCGSSAIGNCRWTSDCGGASISNQCPGPSGFKCCQSAATGFGVYPKPSFPAIGACKAISVNSAKKIVDAFPGRIREIGCTRACECGGNNSDHCCGKATDMMCSDAGGTPTISGKEIAEWVMNHRVDLNLKYVIWGQKIWDPSRDSVKSWNSWRTMDDRHSITQNHWDHVHVSYN